MILAARRSLFWYLMARHLAWRSLSSALLFRPCTQLPVSALLALIKGHSHHQACSGSACKTSRCIAHHN